MLLKMSHNRHVSLDHLVTDCLFGLNVCDLSMSLCCWKCHVIFCFAELVQFRMENKISQTFEKVCFTYLTQINSCVVIFRTLKV